MINNTFLNNIAYLQGGIFYLNFNHFQKINFIVKDNIFIENSAYSGTLFKIIL